MFDENEKISEGTCFCVFNNGKVFTAAHVVTGRYPICQRDVRDPNVKYFVKFPGIPCLEYKVDFYGAKPFNTVFPSIKTSTIGSSFFDWDGGHPKRIVYFMRLIGYTDINLMEQDKRRSVVELYKNMPIWPARNSIKVSGNVILVKLGGIAGRMHQL